MLIVKKICIKDPKIKFFLIKQSHSARGIYLPRVEFDSCCMELVLDSAETAPYASKTRGVMSLLRGMWKLWILLCSHIDIFICFAF